LCLYAQNALAAGTRWGFEPDSANEVLLSRYFSLLGSCIYGFGELHGSNTNFCCPKNEEMSPANSNLHDQDVMSM